ncbi:MAG: hypothetical protein FWD41_01990 [Actinomycetia bacterium]|nr:hypothetical protein [Actinomycetes bacterium]
MMRPELVQFFEDYQQVITIRSFNLSSYPNAAEGFSVSAIPTQFFFNADGSPYVPRDLALGFPLELLTDAEGTHTLTRHVGALSYDDLVALHDDLVAP